jgi:O-antigen/teichoic acid export membrane protein
MIERDLAMATTAAPGDTPGSAADCNAVHSASKIPLRADQVPRRHAGPRTAVTVGTSWLRGVTRTLYDLIAEEHLRRSVVAMLDQAVVSLAAFATVAILGRVAGQAELGRYYLPFTILLFAVNIQGELVTSAYAVYRQRRGGKELRQYSGSVVVFEGISLILGAVVFFGCWLVSSWTSGPDSLRECFLLLIVAGPLWQLRAFCRYYAFANLQFATPLIMDAVTTVVQIGILILLARSSQLTASTTYIALAVACAVGVATWVSVGRPVIEVRTERLWTDWKENWAFSRWALASQVIGCTTPYVIPWLVANGLGQAEAGTYAACVNLCGIATMFVLGIAHSLTPHAARAYATGGLDRLRRVLVRSATAFAFGLGCYCLIMFLVGEPLMGLLYGPRFTDTQWVLNLLALATLANSMAIVAGNGIWALDCPRANLWGDLVTLVVTVGAAIMLLPVAGLLGVAGAVLLGNALGAATRVTVLAMLWKKVRPNPCGSAGLSQNDHHVC